jgi:hypothetical protein
MMSLQFNIPQLSAKEVLTLDVLDAFGCETGSLLTFPNMKKKYKSTKN